MGEPCLIDDQLIMRFSVFSRRWPDDWASSMTLRLASTDSSDATVRHQQAMRLYHRIRAAHELA